MRLASLPDGRIEILGRLDSAAQGSRDAHRAAGDSGGLAQHPSVQNCVVLGDTRANGAPGVSPCVSGPSQVDPDEGDRASEGRWRTVWSQVYQNAPGSTGTDLRAAGWNESITGLPMAADYVAEWAEQTAKRILAERPKRVLEIGCGNGILLRRIAPHCERYVGVDLAPEAVGNLERELREDPQRWSHVEVRQGSADSIEDLFEAGIDAVVINSVVQYFPDVDYAVRVLRRAIAKTKEAGFVFVGDVRSLPLARGAPRLDRGRAHARIHRRGRACRRSGRPPSGTRSSFSTRGSSGSSGARARASPTSTSG